LSEICVLGAGPSGLLAAKAVEDLGHEPVIYAIKKKSNTGGAIYIHEPLPGLTGVAPDAYVTFHKLGTREGYARKVYGHEDADCSWDDFPEGVKPAWSMRETYDLLWRRYESQVIDKVVTADMVGQLLLRHVVISTIPAPAICLGNQHWFEQKDIWVRRDFNLRNPGMLDPCIVYNGDPAYGWYRASSLFGHGAMEFGHHVENAAYGFKPIRTNCDCHSDNGTLIRAGRFGTWKKGVLIHHTYNQVSEALQELAVR
jgi:hypothetical protein